MTAGIVLGVFVWLLLGRFCLNWLRFNTHVPLPGRKQDVRAVMRRGRQVWTP